MARTDTLGHFLTDVANAIRTKTGSQGTIQASTFDTAIGNISGGDYTPRKISFNGYNGAELNYELSHLDLSNCTNYSYMFYDCSSITTLDLSSFDTSDVTSMHCMFTDCSALTSINLSSFDTTKVTNMDSMFSLCSYLTSLDLSNFYTPVLRSFDGAFSYCTRLTFLDIRNMTFDNVTDAYGLFEAIPANCEIIVKSQTEKTWVLTQRSDLTNVKTVAEYEAE